MGRSLKKGPYIDEKLLARIDDMNRSRQKRVLKTWARRSTIAPEFVGHTLAVHNGRKFIPVYVTENMVGHRLGEFALTRISPRAMGRAFFIKHRTSHLRVAVSDERPGGATAPPPPAAEAAPKAAPPPRAAPAPARPAAKATARARAPKKKPVRAKPAKETK